MGTARVTDFGGNELVLESSEIGTPAAKRKIDEWRACFVPAPEGADNYSSHTSE